MKHNLMNTRETYINAIGCATPQTRVTQSQAADYLAHNYDKMLTARSKALIKKIFSNPSITQRYLALSTLDTLIHETADQRAIRFTDEAVNLAVEAIRRALSKTLHATSDVTALVVNTCTGYICPGISTYLAEELQLPPETKLFDLVGSGCGGAIPNIQVAKSFLPEHNDGIVVSVSVEICSATFQMGNDMSLIVSNALFGDGAAAAVLSERQEGWRVLHSASLTMPEHRETIRYIYKNGQLHNQLTREVPGLAGAILPKVIADVLAPFSLQPQEIAHWALHPGGDKVLTALQKSLSLADDQMVHSRHILQNYGNMSSPTVWFILDEVAKDTAQEEYCLMAAFGAGFSAHACLLRKC